MVSAGAERDDERDVDGQGKDMDRELELQQLMTTWQFGPLEDKLAGIITQSMDSTCRTECVDRKVEFVSPRSKGLSTEQK